MPARLQVKLGLSPAKLPVLKNFVFVEWQRLVET